ncbi:hypothetical protein [Variovorax paradoxus]|jgi:hypothetical protein|uniref:hypothetical protein n=1 Tax=Variovorax paradoxus TaxID=34073 RepID=UPI0030CE9C9F
MKVLLVLGACALAFVCTAASANYPCSGSKGGVSHCSGALFVCNDGSISGSKKVCTGPQGGGGSGAVRNLLAPSSPAGAAGDCACRSGRICTGPRGGQYCLSDSGAKSYVRR